MTIDYTRRLHLCEMKLIAIELIIFFQDDTFCSKEYIQKQAEELYRHLHEHEDYGEQL